MLLVHFLTNYPTWITLNIPSHPKTSFHDVFPGSAFHSLHPQHRGLIPAVSTRTKIHPFFFHPLPSTPSPLGEGKRSSGEPREVWPSLQSAMTGPPEPPRTRPRLDEEEHTLLQTWTQRVLKVKILIFRMSNYGRLDDEWEPITEFRMNKNRALGCWWHIDDNSLRWLHLSRASTSTQ